MAEQEVIDQKPKKPVAPAKPKVPAKLSQETGLAQFKRGLESESKRRGLMDDYIANHLKEGVDYGVIPGTGNKKTLLKPGAEKFLPLLDLVCEFEKDNDTWEMLGSKPGVVAYVCKVYTKKSHSFVGEGRGICDKDEKVYAKVPSSKYTALNTAVKIAEKRAQVDAVLRVYGLSDVFAQDMDDPSYQQQAQSRGSGGQSSQPAKKGVTEETGEAATEPQKKYVDRLLKQKKHTEGDIDVEGLTKKQAHDLIDKLQALPNKENNQEEGQ